MLTSLPKHRGQHGGLVAVGVLVSTSVVVWTTQTPPAKPPVAAEPADTIRSSAQRPAASVARPEPRPVASIKRPAPTKRGTVTATGLVTYDETRTSHVTAPVSGWFEKNPTVSVGRTVRQFEPLGVVYSAEVYAATVEVIKQVREFESQELLDAARVKLLRWGMPKPTLDRIEQTMKPQAALPIVTRVQGVVVAEQGAPRGLIEPGELFTVTDPTRVMVFAEVPDADAARLTAGMPAKLTVEGVANPIATKLSYVFRRSDEGMRTVRFDVHSYAKLKPGAKVGVMIPMRPGT
jgi:hypothetical protein